MRKSIGSLNCLVRQGENAKHSVVLLHGFGADHADLFPLADLLDPRGEWNFYFPNAPHEVPVGPMWSGRGWFPISVRDLESGIDFSEVRPPGLDESAAMVSDLLFHLESEKLVLGGFSQGAMVASEVAMTQAQDLDGLILYSPTLLDSKNWSVKAQNLTGKKILMSHGHQDSVLPFAGAQKLCDLFKNAGANCQMIAFSGAHEIPSLVLQKTRAFLETL